jgi:hypothetical protein
MNAAKSSERKIIFQGERYVLSYLYSTNLEYGIQQQSLHCIYIYTLYMYLQHSLFFFSYIFIPNDSNL